METGSIEFGSGSGPIRGQTARGVAPQGNPVNGRPGGGDGSPIQEPRDTASISDAAFKLSQVAAGNEPGAELHLSPEELRSMISGT